MPAFWRRLAANGRHDAPQAAAPPALRSLTHLDTLEAATWLRESLTTFGSNVASVVPGRFPAYVRILHPFDFGGGSSDASTWRETLARAGHSVGDPADAVEFAMRGVPDAQAWIGSLPARLTRALVEHLARATGTPHACYFAIWEGFASSVVPPSLAPRLELLHRGYHLFGGPLAAARTSYAEPPFPHQSPNLWWPADRAWCVATEIDFAWTYVGGSRACVDAILADPRFEAAETSPGARW